MQADDYFVHGQPNGGSNQNYYSWGSHGGGLWDETALNRHYSFCAIIAKGASYQVLRGLCGASRVETLYTAGNSNGKFVWKGNMNARIVYVDRWILNDSLSKGRFPVL